MRVKYSLVTEQGDPFSRERPRGVKSKRGSFDEMHMARRYGYKTCYTSEPSSALFPPSLDYLGSGPGRTWLKALSTWASVDPRDQTRLLSALLGIPSVCRVSGKPSECPQTPMLDPKMRVTARGSCMFFSSAHSSAERALLCRGGTVSARFGRPLHADPAPPSLKSRAIST